MYPSNQICKYLGAIAFCLFSTTSPIVYGAELKDVSVNKISSQRAEKIACDVYKKYSKNKVKKFTCRFITENQDTWAFGCEETTDTPRPGGVLFVNVDKISGKPTSYPGK